MVDREEAARESGTYSAEVKNTVGMFSNKKPKKVMTEKGLNQKQYKDRYSFLARVYEILDR